jgi:hypothetical protein
MSAIGLSMNDKLFSALREELKSGVRKFKTLEKELRERETRHVWATGPLFSFVPYWHELLLAGSRPRTKPQILSREPRIPNDKYRFIFAASDELLGIYRYGRVRLPVSISLAENVDASTRHVYVFADGGRALTTIFRLKLRKGAIVETYALSDENYKEHWIYKPDATHAKEIIRTLQHPYLSTPQSQRYLVKGLGL